MFKRKLSKVLLCVLIAFITLVAVGLIIYPHIEIKTENKLIICSYSDYLSEFEQNPSYNEIYFYNEKRDISVNTYESKKFLFFYVFKYDYIQGDFRETEFILKEEYINNFLENAEIIENTNKIDIKSLIEGKKAIVGNTRYLGNDYENAIFYKLDGKYEELYVFYKDDLLVIQVGSPDELPKFIAYK